MNTLQAFAMGEANRGKESMVFDWDKAARLIVENHAQNASAGLQCDWEWTGGEIFTGGKPNKKDYTYLASKWAVPEIIIDGGDPIPCYKMAHEVPEWNADTKWPKSALAILAETEVNP